LFSAQAVSSIEFFALRRCHPCVGFAAPDRWGNGVKKKTAILGSALFFVAAPCVVAGVIPWWITRWEFWPPFFGLELTRAIGIVSIVAGVCGLVDSFARFALQGLGTPAPIAPTRHLLVTGLYLAVVAIILGQAILLGDWRLIIYGALFWAVFHLFVVSYEEPTLRQTFGAEYEIFRANAPRWIPRVTRGEQNEPCAVSVDPWE
jgi:protein-S-isoprenylcysteine O-methyltransferase Ste14